MVCLSGTLEGHGKQVANEWVGESAGVGERGGERQKFIP